MQEEIKKTFWLSVVESIAFAVIGAFMLFYKERTTSIISYAFGAIFAVLGAMALIKYFIRKDESKYSRYGIVYGLVFLVIASIFIFKVDAVTNYLLPYMIGMFIMVSALLKVEYIFILKKAKNNNWKVSILLTLAAFLCGFILIFNPFSANVLNIAQVIGMSLVLYAILNVIHTYILRCNIKDTNEIIANEKE